ncbi:uncharacterized protein LOC112892726 [Panicum hallii]|uniref:uncharacterized protein LOC112892726 n=1 Tax=Panicum hallii TaxID=206008 RepID=UPI000DF4CD88|nr:uncharacterized protein LOC112892726 [Panicum hallii]
MTVTRHRTALSPTSRRRPSLDSPPLLPLLLTHIHPPLPSCSVTPAPSSSLHRRPSPSPASLPPPAPCRAFPPPPPLPCRSTRGRGSTAVAERADPARRGGAGGSEAAGGVRIHGDGAVPRHAGGERASRRRRGKQARPRASRRGRGEQARPRRAGVQASRRGPGAQARPRRAGGATASRRGHVAQARGRAGGAAASRQGHGAQAGRPSPRPSGSRAPPRVQIRISLELTWEMLNITLIFLR